MKNILFPTDFSACADNALNYAIGIADKLKTKIILHHSCMARSFVNEIPMEESLDDNVLHSAINRLKKYADLEPFKTEKILFEEDICFGDADNDIVALANKKKVDLIVMGTRGSNNFTDLLFGKTSASVMEKAKCPVMVIPPRAKYNGFQKIVYAADYRATDFQNIYKLANIAKVYNAEIIIVHVSLSGFTDSLERETFNNFKDEIKSFVSYEKLSFQLQVGLNTGDVLDAVVKDEKADLLAMSIRQTNFLLKLLNESITNKMLHQTEIPIISFSAALDVGLPKPS
jgi:nucleotide-binding universal stress UspA family protein